MEIITGETLSNLVDYSFGDHMGQFFTPKIPNGFMKYANAYNQEFLDKAKEFEGKVMTLYIDNIRLYPRPITHDPKDKDYIDYLLKTNNLLALCSLLPSNNFIIFTSQEDTPIDNLIQLPFNVLKIYAVNAFFNNEQIIPFPFGLQRQMTRDDNRLNIIRNVIKTTSKPKKLLYINCGIERNAERLPLAKFGQYSWVTTRFDKDSKFFPYDRYSEFLSEIRDHKFVVCPKGHGFDTHRIWETLYMRRVPIMLDHPYFRVLLKGFPILFVDNWEEITELSLATNDYLFEEALTMDLSRLDLHKMYQEAILNKDESPIIK